MTPEDERRGTRWEVFAFGVIAIFVVIFGLSELAGWTGSGRSQWPTAFESNGERIYFTGTSESGQSIRSFGGNQHNLMMRGNACVACHGADREGDRLFMSFWQSAPAITPEALAGDHGDDGHAHDAYDRASLVRALTDGIRPDGSTIGANMPRWQLSDTDMQDLVAYLLPYSVNGH